MKKIAILGAGLVGRLLAHRLSSRTLKPGQTLTLYERGGKNAEHTAAYVAAAMLAPLAESAISERLISELGLASLQKWPQWLTQLHHSLPTSTQTTTPIFFQREGTLVLWHRQDKEEAQRFYQCLDLQWAKQENCLPKRLDGTQLNTLEPALSNRFSHGIYLPQEGQLDNRALLSHLLFSLEHQNVTCHWQHTVTPAAVDADLIIDCRGLGAKNEWNQQHYPSQPLRGVRGEVLRVYAPDVHLKRPIRFLHPRYPIYIAPKADNIYVIGATEIESEDHSDISVRSTLELLSAAYTLHRGFGEARILEARSECRPTLANHLPKIVFDGQRLIAINGLYRHGYLIAPAIIEATLALIQQIENTTLTPQWLAQQPWPELFHLQPL